MNPSTLSACIDVLVVEDDPVWLGFYRGIFKRRGIACEMAATIEDAREKLESGHFRFLLCDGTGWDTIIQQGIALGCVVVIQTGDPESFQRYGVVTVSKLSGPNAVTEAFFHSTGLGKQA